jgi:hypothetical protein
MQPRSRITPADLTEIAWMLVDRHGGRARDYALQAVDEMEAQGDERRAGAWRALGSVIEDALQGRLPRAGVTTH